MGAVESAEQRARTGEFVNDPWWNPASKPAASQGADPEKKQLQAKLEAVEAELSSAHAEVKRLSAERQELEQQLSEAEDERQESAQQLEESERRRRQAARQLQEAEEQRRQLGRSLEQAEGERARLEARVAALERRLAQPPEAAAAASGRQAAAAFVSAESRAGSNANQDETRARAAASRPWIQQTAAGQQRTASSATAEGNSSSGGDQRQQQQQQQQKGQQQQQGQGQGHGQGQQRAADSAEERRALSASKAAELELFKREVNVKREARHRAMAAVSAELERLRKELRRERCARRRLEVRLSELGEQQEDEEQPDDEGQDQELGDDNDEEPGDLRCQVTLEEDLHLRLEQVKNELETERELRRTLEDSVEQLQCQLQGKEQLQQEVEELRADLHKEQQTRTEVQSELEKLQAAAVLVEKEGAADDGEQVSVARGVVACLEGQLDSERSARRQLERQLEAMVEAQLKRDRKEAAGTSRLEDQLEKEKAARQELERQLAAARQEASREEGALLQDLDRLRDELDSERDRANRASDVADAARGRAEAGEEERRRLHDQVAALKDVAAVGRQLLQLREEQVERLEARLQASEAASAAAAGSELQARLPAAVEAAVGELRVEYERQLRAMTALRQLYGERAAAAAADAEQRERRLRAEEQARQEAEALAQRLQEEARHSGEEASALREEVSQIHAALARLLDAASVSPCLALDDLARRLQQNHGLLADIAAEGLDAAELSRTLMDLAAQAEAAGAVAHEDEDAVIDSDAKPEAKADAASSADGAPPAPAMDRAEIATNLPKVWKVLMELLSQQQAAGESGEAAEEGCGSDVKSRCYKSVDTPYGPRLVISVSQTFLRLKELILEKKSLQRELSRLQQLNGHLETELGRQQQRLSLVSSELRKTWGVVGRMRAQHRQLHTHETLLRHELQHKRQLLRQLREELATCRETWQRARQKSSESEVEWRALRTEFAERRRQRDAGSTESGCYSDSGDDAKETPSGGSCSPVAEETTELDVDMDAEEPNSCPPAGDEDDPASCPTVSMVKKLKQQLASFSRSLESVARDDEVALQSIFSLPAITIPEAVYRHLGWSEEASNDCAPECEEPDPQKLESTITLSSPTELQATVQDDPAEGETPGVSHTEEVQKEEGPPDPPPATLSETEMATVEMRQKADSSMPEGAGVLPASETESDRRKRFQDNAYRRIAAYLEVPPGILEDEIFLPTSSRSGESPVAEPQPPAVAPLDQQALEARAERLRSLEEQCQQLVRRVTRTAHRGDRLYSRLEELHEQYGSSSSPDEASPAAPASPVTMRRTSRGHQSAVPPPPPPPPPLPSELRRIPAPPHLPDTLPTRRLPTAATTTTQQPPPPLLLPPADSPPPGNGDPSSGDGPAEG